jgi:beta-lactam-binding protein with PASTA domain
VGTRILAAVPAVLVVAAACLLASATISIAAETPAKPHAQSPRKVAGFGTVVVPDLRKQAFVFAKGILEDEGYAWRVVGKVHGYAANLVVSQSPLPGTRVVDTGSPLIKLELSHSSRYPQAGAPEDTSPYSATAIRLAGHKSR